MYAWVRENATEERKPKDTEEQFIYKARKKAIGPFKQQMWGMPRRRAARDRPDASRSSFTFLMTQAEDQRHRGGGGEVRQGAGGRARSRRRDRRRRRHDHRGREEGRRARRLTAEIADCRLQIADLVSSLFAVMRRASACAAHHTTTGLVLRVDQPAATVTISHDAFPGYMDAMAMPFDLKGSARTREADAGRSREVPALGEGRPLVGRSRRGRVGRAGGRRAAEHAGGAGAGAGRHRDARLRADRSGRPAGRAVGAEGQGRRRHLHLLALSAARLLPADGRELQGAARALRVADGSRSRVPDDQLRSALRHARGARAATPRRSAPAGRAGISSPAIRRRSSASATRSGFSTGRRKG